MQSWMALLVAGMLLGPVSGSAVAFADTSSVPSSTQQTVEVAHNVWEDGLGIRNTCSSGVSIIFEELEGRRGEYRTASAEVVIDPTDSVDGIVSIVVHELSHHTFLACGVFADAEFTEAFYAAQGLPADRDWFDYSHGWSQTPAEHFAEAMATTITGSGEGGIKVSAETQSIITRWLVGAPVAPPLADAYEPVPYSAENATPSPVADGGLTEAPSVTSAAEPAPPAPSHSGEVAQPETVASAPTVSLATFGNVIDLVSQHYHEVLWLRTWKVGRPI